MTQDGLVEAAEEGESQGPSPMTEKGSMKSLGILSHAVASGIKTAGTLELGRSGWEPPPICEPEWSYNEYATYQGTTPYFT